MDGCVFCRIARREIPAHWIYEDDQVMVFLDVSPMFAGHCLVCPKQHVDNMLDLADEMIAPLFATARSVARAVEEGLGAGGSLVCVNNRISQSVPHLHVHVIPRRPKDGLKGFFWPRVRYGSDEEIRKVVEALRGAMGAG